MNPAHSKPASLVRTLALLAATFGLGAALSPAWSQTAVPDNLGAGLKELVQSYLGEPENFRQLRANRRLEIKNDKVLVVIYPDGRVPLAQLLPALETLGVQVVAVNAHYRAGAISAYLPLGRAAEASRAPGVSAVALSHKPVTSVGLTTSQGAVVHKTGQLNLGGLTGAGITVGVLSDSFNTNTTASTRAPDDVATGDLPALTNSNPNSPGVKFLLDSPGGSDEGRGMAQIVYDLAPGVDLCFATALGGEPAFANNIRTLRTNAACSADVIVDDIIYLAEPMFSDGQVAQAVDEVVTSSTLAGKKVTYFSSAGNRGKGFASDFRLVSNSDARGAIDAADTTINLSRLPRSLNTQGGFHDFDPGPGVDISQTVKVDGDTGTIVFQWDDPFNVPGGGVSTDFNLLVFDSRGRYVASRSGIANNFSTNQPLEIPASDLAAGQTYRIVIAKSSATRAPGVPQQASRLRYVVFGGTYTGEFNDAPGTFVATYGHNSALNGNGVAAYAYDDTFGAPPFNPVLEDFSSPGPVTIAFDKAGNRLTPPEVRNKPDFAAADGVNTTFFPPGPLSSTDVEGDGFPNFFGTSAAAPHAAGIAALLLQKAGGPNSLSAAAIRTALQSTAPPRDIDPLFAAAGAGVVSLTGNGAGSTDANFFRIGLGGSGVTLTALTLNLAPAGLVFDPSASGGFPLTTGTRTGATLPAITSAGPSAPTATLTLTFTSFNSGDTLNFGIDRDLATGGFGNSADALAGATFTATTATGTLSGTFVNTIGGGYTPFDGFGLVDAQAAADSLP
ncbi:S8 family peptidase [Gloeobacter morelensis]|uniref:S8 family serine peptidase n=1 Tax=Gloeobacter morelensis MG652769 TaxID=2781736 RepID=A0ABY3PJH9_9CYAN|nr:S8 family serine peptidase [Gloeobacter morelensis]UFP93708.1 S8 family serine peptidase [Gloeobacter morelensis MG652769]